MRKVPDLRETPDVPPEITQAALDGDLILFVGSGVSMLVGLPSWTELAWAVLNDLRDKGYINYSELEQLKTLDPKKLLSIAESIAEDNGFTLEMTRHLTTAKKETGIYKHINKIGCVCVTTNYDELLAPRFYKTSDGSTTATPITRVLQKNEFHAGHLNTPGTVVHLHGSISQPATMILTTKQYLEHYDDRTVQNFLGELFKKKTILFIGYGLEEAEILEHILRRGGVKHTIEKKRFALQAFFLSQDPLYRKLHDYYQKSFGVHLVGYIRDHNNYKQLEFIAKTWSEQIEVRRPALTEDLEYMDEVLG
jgi:hypothetical protein